VLSVVVDVVLAAGIVGIAWGIFPLSVDEARFPHSPIQQDRSDLDLGTKVVSLPLAVVVVVEAVVVLGDATAPAAAALADLDIGIQQHRRCFSPGTAGKGRAP
jgi:hypothetical protein